MKNFKKFIKAGALLSAFILFSYLGQAFAQEKPVETVAKPETPKQKISLQTTEKMRKETRFVVFSLLNFHYLKQALQDLDIREFIREYCTNLDFLKLVFLAEDVQNFQESFAPSMDIMLNQGTLLPAFSIYEKFVERSDSRIAWIKGRMDKDFDLNGNDVFAPDRTKATWPANIDEADSLWEKRIKYDIIAQMLSYTAESHEDEMLEDATADTEDSEAAKKARLEAQKEKLENAPKTDEEKLKKAREEVLKRYDRLFSNYNTQDSVDVQEVFLNSLCQLYDPHTSFMSEYTAEDFEIAMHNALIGIGAMLQDKDGICTISEFITGGPAEQSKQLNLGDKIMAVGQAEGEMVDVIGMKLRKIIKMIRGKENTVVRLLVEPANNPSARQVVSIVRKEVKLTTKLAKAYIYEMTDADKTFAIGVIDAPVFYGKSRDENGASKGFSIGDDVSELVQKLKAKGAKGIVLDLRKNGGGYLEEAVELTGLFIKTGPVVQAQDTRGNITTLSDDNPKVVWDGPLVVLVSRLSASASEISAGALKNYKRAIIVGDKTTHGKGTIQTLISLNKFDPSLKSTAKITIQKWYLPSGESTQVKGISSDIVLPSVFDYMEVGESHKDYALPWDSIRSADIPDNGAYCFDKATGEILLKKLSAASLERQKTLSEFKFLNKRLDWFKTKRDQKEFSLNYKVRLEALNADIAFSDSVKAEQKEFAKQNYKREEVLLDSALEKESPKSSASSKDGESTGKKSKEDSKKSEDEDFDIALRESVRIMSDWIKYRENPELLKEVKN